MDDHKIKWANCCNLANSCSGCHSLEQCVNWTRFLSSHLKGKRYAHFDKRTSLQCNRTRKNVLDAEWVKSHAFYPLIQFEQKKTKVRHGKHGITVVSKPPRVIRYCSHIDRCIFQRYSYLLDEAYEKYVHGTSTDRSAIAYRREKGLSNIDYAKRAFDFISANEQCVVLVADFENFFDNLEHASLKQRLCDVLRTDSLPPDYYAVFKNLTRFSSWEWKSLVKINGLAHCKSARSEINNKERVLDVNTFRRLAKDNLIVNKEQHGIPQGSPLSSVCSNIYMINFDNMIGEIIRPQHGMYYRYCDDIIVVIPFQGSFIAPALNSLKRIMSVIRKTDGVSLQDSKTRYYLCDSHQGVGRVSSIDKNGAMVKTPSSVTYLGFTYNGTSITIADRTITRYYYRMRRKAKTVSKQQKGAKNLYGTYSERSRLISGKGSFVDYANRASSSICANDPAADAIVKRNMEKIAKTINKMKSYRACEDDA